VFQAPPPIKVVIYGLVFRRENFVFILLAPINRKIASADREPQNATAQHRRLGLFSENKSNHSY
jgi:hypothetical protein